MVYIKNKIKAINKYLKLLLWLHRQYSQDNIELLHVKITALLNAGHKILN